MKTNIQNLSLRSDMVVQLLQTQLAKLLELDQSELDNHAPFLEMGADSLFLVEALHIIETTFGLRVSIRQIFEELPNLDSLARYINENLPADWTAPNSHESSIKAPQSQHEVSLPQISDIPENKITAMGESCELPQKIPENLPLTELTLSAHPIQGSRLEAIVEQQLRIVAQYLELLKVNAQLAENKPIPPPTPEHVTSQKTQEAMLATTRPIAAIEKSYVSELTPEQAEYITGFVESYTRRTKKSRAHTQRYRATLADNRASAGFRFSTKETLYPIVGKRALGAKVWDVDDNEYVDIAMGFGVHLFGHNPKFINSALQAQLDKGLQLGLQSEMAGEVGRLVCQLTGMERATFCNTGTEAIMTALRLARTATRRNKIVMFSGSYHGHFDGTLAMSRKRDGEYISEPIAPGTTPAMVSDVILLDYAEEKSLQTILAHRHELAAVLVEPIQSRKPGLQPAEFLKKLRQITHDSGIALIFDEMITGFRIHQGGAQAWFDIKADIATYGKIIGGGMPIGVIAGKAAFMDGIDGGFWQFGDGSYPGADTTFFAGTFCKHPLTMVAARAVLSYLVEQGPELQQSLNRRTDYLAKSLNSFFQQEGFAIQIANCGSVFRFSFNGNMDLLFQHLIAKGIYIWEGRSCFLSTAHTDADIDFIIQSVKESVLTLREHKFISTTSKLNYSAVPPVKSVPTGFWDRKKIKPPLTRKNAVAATRKESNSGNSRIDFSFYFFGDYKAEFRQDKYDLLFKGAKFADENGFSAIWVPERHFHSFGGFSPNPSVVCAALARETSRLKLRAGSVVAPLHHPIRIAEEWAVVDNLSQGRVGISFASGWHPDDFVLAPETFGNHRELMFERIEQIQQLWSGNALSARNGKGNMLEAKIFPMPRQTELPVWITIVNNADTYRRAGAIGAGVLTNLMGQTVEDLASNIALYRQSLAEHGFDPAAGHVTVLAHTFVGSDMQASREQARQPFYDYISSTMGLFQNLARAEGKTLDHLTEDDRQYILAKAYESYINNSALIGSPESCAPIVDSLLAVGVDEIACFIDFGLDATTTIEGFQYLNQLRQRYETVEKHTNDKSEYNPATRVAVSSKLSAAPVEMPEPHKIVRSYKLTAAQEHLWVMDSLGGDASLTYNMCVSLKLKGKLNTDALEKALHEIVQRHESLRTKFDKNGEFQQVVAMDKVVLSKLDFSNLETEQRRKDVAEWFAKEGHIAFDLHKGPLFRFYLLTLEDELNILVLSVHHIIIDGWSVGMIARELNKLYSAYCDSQPCHLPQPKQYYEYVDWLESQNQSGELIEHERYWLDRLSGLIPALNLPTDRPRPPMITFSGARETAWIEPELLKELKIIARKNQCTPYMLLLSVFAILLHRLSNQTDIVLSVPLADRSFNGAEGLVGYCANQLPIRSQIDGKPTFVQYLAQTRHLLLEAYEHQDYQYARLLNRLMTKRESSVLSPLHAAIFNFNPTLSVQQLGDLEVDWFSEHINWVADEIAVHLTELNNRILIDWDYNTTLFDADTVQGMLKSFKSLLKGVAINPETPVAELPMLNDEDRDALLHKWPSQEVVIAENDLVHRQFERQVRKTPDVIAVSYPSVNSHGQQQLTYRELNQRANALAAQLRDHGIGPDKLVGVFVDRSLELVISLLAVLKAGGAYVPLDPAYPLKRLEHVLNDAAVDILLTQTALVGQLPATTATVVTVDATSPINGKWSPDDSGNYTANVNHLAYVIYTSGSTGKPKGVEISHKSLTNFLNSMVQHPGLSERDTLLSVTSPSFDISALEIFLPLIVGARLVISPREVTLNGSHLRTLISNSAATVMQATPATWKLLLTAGWEPGPGLMILCGGEPMSSELAEELCRHGASVYNMYGPTETTIWSSVQSLQNFDVSKFGNKHIIPIGSPIANTQFYVLDSSRQLVPIGVHGELYIGGEGLARGYRNQPELTREKFIPDLFSCKPGARLYRTGDLVRALRNGCIEFLGRIDFQVKIRGFRVELGEIESLLQRHPQVKESLVVADGDNPENTRLIAYVVPTRDGFTLEEMRDELREQVADYMVPSALVCLDAFPLTPNGKIDRKALPKPDTTIKRSEIVAPRDDLERELQEIWEEILEVHPIGVTDDFFELGGHSFLAVRLTAAVQQRFQKRLPLTTLLGNTTIERVANYLRLGDVQESYSPMVALQAKGDQAPFFCIHPIGGHVACYMPLVRHLGQQQPFYAFQSIGIDGGEPLTTIQEMASNYLKALRDKFTKGPYHLGGWSIGGVIAYEMAQQLLQSGEEVASLTLIDSVNPVELNLPEIDEMELLGLLANDLKYFTVGHEVITNPDFSELHRTQQLKYLLDRAKAIHLLPREARVQELQGIMRVFKANLSAANLYRPNIYPGTINFISAINPVVQLSEDKLKSTGKQNLLLERVLQATAQARFSWESLALGGVDVVEVAADHYSLMREPAVKTVSRCISSYVRGRAEDAHNMIQQEPPSFTAEPAGRI